MAELSPLVQAWIRYAEDDWHDSQILASAGGNRRSVCFHLQQCLEKLFKAELMRLAAPVPKTHNLRELSDLLQQAGADWSAASIDLNRLSLAAVDFRYPDPSEPEPDIDLVLIQSIAADLRGRLLDRLGVKH
ncbi:HEPN domain-containing protein [Cyanobium sp. HWJ4-Hawea]|uniref:HEPN domain-containing protein n=1 Tax=Cyanobium sp. HWJ4-Hawea TaxID=2823713 RepID=UPI0020CCB190|nr:HEPN domain-containing protein [Cyanobium sp. HWJ4-Hawea]MCP9808698.1 HEPN domain-containing protein [Cyanobium sp. HWJ4-Hawea]